MVDYVITCASFKALLAVTHFLYKDFVSASLKYIFKFAILNFTGDLIVWQLVGGTCCLNLQGR
jgi:hypothetical protein